MKEQDATVLNTVCPHEEIMKSSNSVIAPFSWDKPSIIVVAPTHGSGGQLSYSVMGLAVTTSLPSSLTF